MSTNQNQLTQSRSYRRAGNQQVESRVETKTIQDGPNSTTIIKKTVISSVPEGSQKGSTEVVGTRQTRRIITTTSTSSNAVESKDNNTRTGRPYQARTATATTSNNTNVRYGGSNRNITTTSQYNPRTSPTKPTTTTVTSTRQTTTTRPITTTTTRPTTTTTTSTRQTATTTRPTATTTTSTRQTTTTTTSSYSRRPLRAPENTTTTSKPAEKKTSIRENYVRSVGKAPSARNNLSAPKDIKQRSKSPDPPSLKRKAVTRGDPYNNILITHIIMTNKPAEFHIFEEISDESLKSKPINLAENRRKLAKNKLKGKMSSTCSCDGIEIKKKEKNLEGKITRYQHVKGLGMTDLKLDEVNSQCYTSEIKDVPIEHRKKMEPIVDHVEKFRTKEKRVIRKDKVKPDEKYSIVVSVVRRSNKVQKQ